MKHGNKTLLVHVLAGDQVCPVCESSHGTRKRLIPYLSMSFLVANRFHGKQKSFCETLLVYVLVGGHVSPVGERSHGTRQQVTLTPAPPGTSLNGTYQTLKIKTTI